MNRFKRIINYLNQLKKLLLDLLFPIECLGCGKENIWLCEKCFEKIKLRMVDGCVVCKKNSNFGATHPWCEKETQLDGVIVAAKFKDELLQEVIHKFKYNFARELGSPLSRILINKIKQLDEKEGQPQLVRLLFGADLILVPVPLHWRRFNWRGFNQAEILARKLAQAFGLEVNKKILKRRKNTKPQTKLKREKRLKNIHGAFQINKELCEKLKNTKVLLVDDVTTTAATLNECARVLKECGVREVWAIVLARG